MRYLLPFFALLLLAAIAGATEFRELFEREFLTKQWAGSRTEVSACLQCHASEGMKAEYRRLTDEWRQSWHFENGVSCHDCHGGDPNDSEMAMSHQRGFVGRPKPQDVPQFCGKCHVGIVNRYLQSGHGKALKSSGTGPNCVTCHGAHNIQKANIDIINEKLCSRCHSYERAKIMKQALFATEAKMQIVEKRLEDLKTMGVYTDRDDRNLFNTQAEYRTLFHSVDVSLVKKMTDQFTGRLDVIEKKIQDTYRELTFRRNFSAFLMLLFVSLAVVLGIMARRPKD
jgi:nitrate/TMAO reductase-like tetraheme cytochrome c subunit